jgi:hypothetical protein
MRLQRYIADLYLNSPRGMHVTTGFRWYLGAGDSTAATRDGDLPGAFSPRKTVLRMSPGWFGPASRSVGRVLTGRHQPADGEAARALYLSLLDEGLTAADSDFIIPEWLCQDLEITPGADSMADDVEGAKVAEDDGDAGGAEASTERLGGSDNRDLRRWLDNIHSISWAFHLFAPEYYAPVPFEHHDELEAAFTELDLPLPTVPPQQSFRQRAATYLEINDTLQELRRDLELSPAEFDALMLDFVPRQVGRVYDDELPEPTRIWFVMANPEVDFELIDTATHDDVFQWQGSYEARPGDIAVMWCRSPRSYVHSIWRVVAPGYADPFFWYYRAFRIGRPSQVPEVSFRDLTNDPVWGDTSGVRARFQNWSGREVRPAEYEALLDLIRSKGGDASALPSLPVLPTEIPAVATEEDVEEKLLEPLLLRAGWTSDRRVRQHSLRMGRGHRIYPDYVLDLKGPAGEEEAFGVVEAKLNLPGPNSIREAWKQAKSYAERLQCELVVLCAIEGVWVWRRTDGRLRFDGFRVFTWSDLQEPRNLGTFRTLVQR